MRSSHLRPSQAGFSLIELMIVVAIIGILSAIAVPNMASGAKKALARSHLKQMVASIKPLRIDDDRNKTLIDITGTVCSICDLGGGYARSVVGLEPNAAYDQRWRNMGFDRTPRDPWGNIYLLDENEGEAADCRMDAFYSAGPDGYTEGMGDGDDVGGDDIVVRMPWMNRTGCVEEGATGGRAI